MFAFKSISAQNVTLFQFAIVHCQQRGRGEKSATTKNFWKLIPKYCKLSIPPAAQHKVNIVNANKDSQTPEHYNSFNSVEFICKAFQAEQQK